MIFGCGSTMCIMTAIGIALISVGSIFATGRKSI
jgi:hypothetical protein